MTNNNDDAQEMAKKVLACMPAVLYQAALKAKQTNTALVFYENGAIRKVQGNDLDVFLKPPES